MTEPHASDQPDAPGGPPQFRKHEGPPPHQAPPQPADPWPAADPGGQGTPAYPPQGYAPQGHPPQGHPPQGYPPLGYPPLGYPQQGYGTEMSPADQRLWAMLAHLSSLVAALIALPFLGPLAIYLVQKDKGQFVRQQAAEALNFQILLVVAGAVAGAVVVLVTIVTLGFAAPVFVLVGFVVGVAILVLIILAAVAANRGENYRYPINWRLVS